MNNMEYINHLVANNEKETVDFHVKVLEAFEDYLSGRGISSIDAADYEAVMEYSKKIAETSDDIKMKFSVLQDYGIFTNQKSIVLAMFEFFEAHKVPKVLLQRIEDALGENKLKDIMTGLDTPNISYTPDQRSNFTRELEKRLGRYIDRGKEAEIYGQVCHGCTRSDFKEVHDKFLQAKNIDKFLEVINREFLYDLIKHSENDALFYGQQINNTVIDYLRSDPKFWWKRRGAKILVTKMPYRTLDFLNAAGLRMKQYYACHCAWARKSIIQEEGPVSNSICSCSLSFTKLYIEAAFDRDLDGRNIETVLDGKSDCCTVEIDIPEDILKEYT